jgi:hypothetical protein
VLTERSIVPELQKSIESSRFLGNHYHIILFLNTVLLTCICRRLNGYALDGYENYCITSKHGIEKTLR